MRPIERLVLRAPNWIGDFVMSLGALRDLRRNFPEARLEVVARPWVGDLYRAVLEVDRVRESRSLREDIQNVRGAFDVAVLFTNSFSSALATFLARVPERWGYATEGRGALLTRSIRPSPLLRGQSQVYYYRAMLAGLGLRVAASPEGSLQCPSDWRESGAALLDGDGPWLGINPGAAYGTAKRWIPERFAAVADSLSRTYGLNVVILGGAAERRLAEEISSRMSTPACVLAGATSLKELLGVLAGLRLLLTNDSGPMHLAGALGTPQVAIFGPTDFRETAPVGPHVLVRESVDCAPCGLRECPIDHRCMKRVTVDRVAEEARGLLGGLPA